MRPRRVQWVEQDKAIEAGLVGKKYSFILDSRPSVADARTAVCRKNDLRSLNPDRIRDPQFFQNPSQFGRESTRKARRAGCSNID